MNDYSALAQRVSMSIAGVRGCLMLSRDGMVLGAHPEGEAETHIRSSWVRFAAKVYPNTSARIMIHCVDSTDGKPLLEYLKWRKSKRFLACHFHIRLSNDFGECSPFRSRLSILQQFSSRSQFAIGPGRPKP